MKVSKFGQIFHVIASYNIFNSGYPMNRFSDASLDSFMNGPVKNALNINVTWGSQSSKVFSALSGDFMKPVTDVG